MNVSCSGRSCTACCLIIEQALEKVYRWASANPHTGSRKDYWPDIFNDVNEGVPGLGFKRRLKRCRLRKGRLTV